LDIRLILPRSQKSKKRTFVRASPVRGEIYVECLATKHKLRRSGIVRPPSRRCRSYGAYVYCGSGTTNMPRLRRWNVCSLVAWLFHFAEKRERAGRTPNATRGSGHQSPNLRVLDCGGKRSATPLSRVRRSLLIVCAACGRSVRVERRARHINPSSQVPWRCGPIAARLAPCAEPLASLLARTVRIEQSKIERPRRRQAKSRAV
jgi:hypothetical protein